MLPLPMLILVAPAPAPPPLAVDFHIVSTADRPASPWKAGEPISLAPQTTPPDDVPADPPDGHASIVPRQRFRQADGFGEQVPLSFAVSQIVPTHVRVSFGPGVQIQSPVTWTGGRPWNQVLATTVAPLGYRIETGHRTVTILRKD